MKCSYLITHIIINPLLHHNAMSRPAKIEADKAIGFKNDLGKFTLTHKNFILYSLGIGFSTGCIFII